MGHATALIEQAGHGDARGARRVNPAPYGLSTVRQDRPVSPRSKGQSPGGLSRLHRVRSHARWAVTHIRWTKNPTHGGPSDAPRPPPRGALRVTTPSDKRHGEDRRAGVAHGSAHVLWDQKEDWPTYCEIFRPQSVRYLPALGVSPAHLLWGLTTAPTTGRMHTMTITAIAAPSTPSDAQPLAYQHRARLLCPPCFTRERPRPRRPWPRLYPTGMDEEHTLLTVAEAAA